MGNITSDNNTGTSINNDKEIEITDPFLDKLKLLAKEFQEKSLDSLQKYNTPPKVDYDELTKYFETKIEKAVSRGSTQLEMRLGVLKTINNYKTVVPNEGYCTVLENLRKYYMMNDIENFTYNENFDYSFRYGLENSFHSVITKFISHWYNLHPKIKCYFHNCQTYYSLEFKLE